MEIRPQIGKHLGTLLERFFDHLPEFERIRAKLEQGDLDGAVEMFRTNLKNSDVVLGLEGAAQKLYGADPARVQEYFGQRKFAEALDYLVSLIPNTPLSQPTLKVAETLCGSVILYKDTHAVIAQTSAWNRIGGEDQTIPESIPGTMGIYHSNSMGGYDITMLAAHAPSGSGIVCIEHLLRLPDGVMERSKTKVTVMTGFTAHQGKNIEELTIPIALKFRKSASVRAAGKDYKVVPVEADHELRLGGYRLEKV